MASLRTGTYVYQQINFLHDSALAAHPGNRNTQVYTSNSVVVKRCVVTRLDYKKNWMLDKLIEKFRTSESKVK